MKKSSFSTTIIIIAVLTVASFAATNPANAQSNPSEWQLSVTGLVADPFNLALSELQALPQTTVNAVLYCVDSPGYVVAQGNWTGVKLWVLLAQAGVSQDAVKVAFYAADGYATDLTLTTAKRDDVIIAYQKDGLPLSESLRLVVPGKWGYKWIAQLTRIELVNFDFKGMWESQGYTDTADITEGSPMPATGPDLQEPYRYPSPSPSPSVAPASPSPSPSVSPAVPSPSPTPVAVADAKAFEFPLVLLVAVPLVLLGLVALAFRKRR
jgi:DMSO/TMAO reductase YedYZ molybdopterin-dependent catalytic subunit